MRLFISDLYYGLLLSSICGLRSDIYYKPPSDRVSVLITFVPRCLVTSAFTRPRPNAPLLPLTSSTAGVEGQRGSPNAGSVAATIKFDTAIRMRKGRQIAVSILVKSKYLRLVPVLALLSLADGELAFTWSVLEAPPVFRNCHAHFVWLPTELSRPSDLISTVDAHKVPASVITVLFIFVVTTRYNLLSFAFVHVEPHAVDFL
mmetsp:Transcript_28885/g.58621  ORF Transcript_28885/g.58621 Transcript_28885/m.58621 type:complete len:203 (+) Transcript_28885:846-1454(+)